MINKILFDKEARESVKKGMELLAKAVAKTYGPAGRNVILGGNFPRSSRDGVSVANGIVFSDPAMNQGAYIMKQAAQETVTSCGDGTSASTILAWAMIEEAEKYLEQGANPNLLKKGIDLAVEQIVAQVKEKAIECKSPEMIKHVATISANNDEYIGGIVAEAYEKIGENGMVILANSNTGETYTEFVKGMEFNSGFISPRFVNTSTFTCDLKNVAVIVTTEEIKKIEGTVGVQNGDKFTPGTGLIGVMERCIINGISLLIVGRDVDGEVIGAMYSNKAQLPSCAVRAPEYGTMQRENLMDIAAVTGATVIDPELGLNLKEMVWEHVGHCEEAIVGNKVTKIIGGAGNPTERIETLKSEYQISKDPTLQRRLAKLTGGVAIIHAGAATEIDRQELKDRLDDAIKATKVAIEEGIVEGGGTALARVEGYERGQHGEDIINGFEIVHEALEAPIKQILANAGFDEDDTALIITNISKEEEGFNAKTMQYENLIENGVVDPVKVVCTSLKNAASVASIVILTGGVLIDTE
jgi:chaperonin GroEL